jgi:hypothetical protein
LRLTKGRTFNVVVEAGEQLTEFGMVDAGAYPMVAAYIEQMSLPESKVAVSKKDDAKPLTEQENDEVQTQHVDMMMSDEEDEDFKSNSESEIQEEFDSEVEANTDDEQEGGEADDATSVSIKSESIKSDSDQSCDEEDGDEDVSGEEVPVNFTRTKLDAFVCQLASIQHQAKEMEDEGRRLSNMTGEEDEESADEEEVDELE